MPATMLHVGMDVHKDSVTLAVLPQEAPVPSSVVRLPNDLGKLRRYFERLTADGAQVRACYEASGAGYVLQRALADWGYSCEVIAPSLIPKRPGVQRKHDKRDAVELARLYRAGELPVIRIPSETEERVRDLVRCREVFQREILKSRHYVLKFLARRGWVYREGRHWTNPHDRWLRQLAAPSSALAAEDRTVLGEYLALLDYKVTRRVELDHQLEQLVLTPAIATAVARFQCFRGLQHHGALVLATEIQDWRRFANPRQVMAYVGLVPREHSSGERERRGAITKAGNTHCRHVLVQAAWAYRFRPQLSVHVKRRQVGQPPGVIAHAWKAQHRLHKLYQRLSVRRRPQIAAVAVARELVGFLWAVAHDIEPSASAAV